MSPIIRLYSKSFARSALLDSVNISHTVHSVDANEWMPTDCITSQAVQNIAAKKLTMGLNTHPEFNRDWGLAADTIVENSMGRMGKPKNIDEARNMLTQLSGTAHKAYTGLAIYSPITQNTASSSHSTEVIFRKLNRHCIESYLETSEWKGAAGAYRIQGRGSFLIESISGLWSTVVGLPLAPLYAMLNVDGHFFYSHSYPDALRTENFPVI